MENKPVPSGILEAFRIGAAFADAQQIDGKSAPYTVVPDGYRVENLEAMLDRPRRHMGRVVLDDVDSFIHYVSVFYVANATRIYYRIHPTPSFTAVLDDGETHQPSWRDHIAHYPCPLSRQWTTWLGANGARVRQMDFAQFLEDNLPDITEPSGAEILGVATKLEAKRTVAFSSGVRLDNGQVQLTYVEDIKGSASKGELRIPEQFKIAIPVFRGGDPYALTARLRYRIPDDNKGGLVMWYQLLRPEAVIEHAADELRDLIEKRMAVTLLHGSPAQC